MERPTYKAINFDLDTNLMTAHLGDYTKGYYQVRKELKNLGFEHRQGSGYVSTKKITDRDVALCTAKLAGNIPWLSSCVKKFDVTVIKKQFSLLHVIQNSCLTPTLTPVSGSGSGSGSGNGGNNSPSHEHER